MVDPLAFLGYTLVAFTAGFVHPYPKRRVRGRYLLAVSGIPFIGIILEFVYAGPLNDPRHLIPFVSILIALAAGCALGGWISLLVRPPRPRTS